MFVVPLVPVFVVFTPPFAGVVIELFARLAG